MESEKMNIVIYARYSSDKQAEQSIEGQLAVCREYAERNGYTIINEYIDRAKTGKTVIRPAFQKMVQDSESRQFQGVLVYQLDRFSRNRYDSALYKEKLKKNGVRVISAREKISDDASGILIEGMLDSLAEYFSAELSQKVKRGMSINAQKGLSNGGTIPFGYKSVNKRLEIDEAKAPIVREIFEMYANGSRVSDIAEYLNARRIKTAHGAAFNKNSLHTILKNKKYIGVYFYGDVEIPDGIPRIIDDDLFNRVAAILERNKKNAGHNKAKTEYLLTTKLFCGHCHAMMVGVSACSSTDRVYYYYSCNNARQRLCLKKNIRKEKIEDLVISKCRESLTEKNIRKIASAISSINEKSQDNSVLRHLQAELRDNDKAIENLMKALETGQHIDLISDRITQKRAEREVIEQQIAVEKMKRVTLTEPEIRFFLTRLKHGDINDIRYRKALINILVNAVYVYDDRITIVFNASDNPLVVDDILLEDIEKNSDNPKSLYSEQYGSPEKSSREAAFFNSIRLRRVRLLRSDIRLTPSDIALCAVLGE